MCLAPLPSNQTALLFGLGGFLEATFPTVLRQISAPLMAHASRQSLRVRRAPSRRGGLYSKIGEQHCIRQLSNSAAEGCWSSRFAAFACTRRSDRRRHPLMKHREGKARLPLRLPRK